MAFSRRLGVVSILGACWFVAVGCGDDEDRKTSTEDGGEGGEGTGTSGTGGKSSLGGNQSTAGNAGKGGTTGGNAGNANVAGEGGSGSGGESGSGSIVGGAGGEGTAGEGGAPGGGASTAGAGGEGGTPGPQLLSCAYECTPGTPCQLVDGQVPCDEVTHRCVDPSTVCSTKADCTPFASFWTTTCSTTADCFEGFEACVTFQGQGWCATLVDGACFPGVSTSLPELGGQGNVDVCVAPGACNQGKCDFACDHDLGTVCDGSGLGNTCNPTTGICECAGPTECDSNLCGADSRCVQCQTADDCPGAQQGLDACVNGRCGCSAVNVCPNQFTNATTRCE